MREPASARKLREVLEKFDTPERRRFQIDGEPWQWTRQEFERAKEACSEVVDRWSRAVWVEPDSRLEDLQRCYASAHLHPLLWFALKPSIWVYRGVPRRCKDAALRVGDWVALDRAYAAEHGGVRCRVLRTRVPTQDIVWAGTDSNEYFYAPRGLESTSSDMHRVIVTWAVQQGLAVPERVLRDYPDLA